MCGGCDFGDTSHSLLPSECPMPVRSPQLTSMIAVGACLLVLITSTAVRAADPPAAPTRAPAAGSEASAVELPRFQAGLWEYRRTLVRGDTAKPQVTTIRKCADPAAEMREKMADLRKKNCQFAPLKRKQDRYVSSWTCPTSGGLMRFRDVLIAKDATSYQDVSETRSAQRATEQKIEATRLGECPGLGAGAPLRPTPKRPSHP
jgi:hypothetical protein